MVIEKRQIFYKEDKLETLKKGTQFWTICRAMNLPLAELRGTDAKDYYLLATDKNGSVIQTDKQNDTAFSYTVYGQASKSQSQLSVLGFNGEKVEQSIHGYLLGLGYHRPYHPGLMRFLSPDCFSPIAKGGVNTYCYCGNDPINHTDPSGHLRIRSLLGHTFRPKFPKYVPKKNGAPLPSYEDVSDPTRLPTYAETLQMYPAEFGKIPEAVLQREIKKLKPFVNQYDSYLNQQRNKHSIAAGQAKYNYHAMLQERPGSDLFRDYQHNFIVQTSFMQHYERKIASVTSEQKRLQEYVATLRQNTR